MVTLDNGGRGRRALEFHATPPGLAWAIEHTWSERPQVLRNAPEGREACRAWRIVPDVAAHLIFNRLEQSGGATAGVRLVGPRTRHVDVDKSRRVLTVGVRLRPGVVPLLVGMPAVEMLDRSVVLDQAVGRSGTHLAEALARLATPEVVRRMHRYLSGALDPCGVDWRVRAVAHHVHRAAGRCSADDLTRLTGVSSRTLRKALRESLGIGPKRFARLHRLHQAICLGLSNEVASWAGLAASAGYVDQPHLIREFRSLLGETPTRFLSRRGSA